MKVKYRVLVISGVLVGLALVGALALGKQRSLCDEELGYCLYQARGWQKEDLEERNLDRYISLRLARTEPDATLQLTTSRAIAPASLRDLSARITGDLKKELADFRLQKSGLIRVDGREAMLIEYEHTYAKEGQEKVPSRQIMVIVPEARRTYYLTAQGRPADIRKARGDIEAMIKSFKVIK